MQLTWSPAGRAAMPARPGRECASCSSPVARLPHRGGHTRHAAACRAQGAEGRKYEWDFSAATPSKGDRLIKELPVNQIRRPLRRTRANDDAKVRALAESIKAIGLQEPIDVLEVDGQYYGFSGCHRYEAHQVLGFETIPCRIRKANKQVLKMHMM